MLNSDKSYSLIKQGLDATNLRGKVIANNIANINTAGYKKFEVAFEESFNNDGTMQVKQTNDKHISNKEVPGTVTVSKNESTSMREDGNNVDLDLEKVNQAANTLMYNTLITQANNKLNSARYVITSGGR